MKAILAVLIFISAFPVAAQTNDIGVWISTQMNDDGGRFAANVAVESRFDDGSGYGLTIAHMFTPNLSGELGVFKTSSDARIISDSMPVANLGDVELTPITAMIRYHFLPGRRFDVYAAGGVAHVLVDDLDSADLRTMDLAPVSLDDKTTWTLGAGLTIGVSPRIAIGVDARYIPLELSGHAAGDSERVSSDLNPLLISAGLKFRF
jgi:outer membrane protein W